MHSIIVVVLCFFLVSDLGAPSKLLRLGSWPTYSALSAGGALGGEACECASHWRVKA